MIKDNQKYFNRMHVVIDAVVIIVSYLLAWTLKFVGPFSVDAVRSLSFEWYMTALVGIVPVYLILYYAFNLYTPKRVQGRRLEAWHIIQANVIGLMAFILLLYVWKQPDFSRGMIFVFFLVNVFLEVIVRNIIREVLRDMRKQGYNQKHILLIGYSRAAEQYIDRIKANPEWGYIVRGILADNVPRGTEYKGIKVLGRIDNLMIVLPENKLDEIAITLGLAEYHKLEKIVGMCEKSGVHTKFIPDYNNIIPTKPYTEDLVGLPVINIRRVPLSNMLNAFVKRTMDIFGALVALTLFSPVMLVITIIIKVTSPGPLIFKQERIGLQNKPFYMYKFRSMVVQDASKEKNGWTVKNDPRVTPIGKFIRKTSIDELPQLINILKGDMSLVGPRPLLVQYLPLYNKRQHKRHSVLPGITGLAQINGRNSISWEEKFEYDVQYAKHVTFLGDLKILFETVFKVLKREGINSENSATMEDFTGTPEERG